MSEKHGARHAQNIREAALIERIKAAVREDLSRSGLLTVGPGHNRGPPFEPEPSVYDIPEFCLTHRLSRSSLYNLWRDGVGPRFFKLGASVRISREAAAAWRADREAATDQRVSQ